MSATRFNVGAGNREFTAVALHDAAYRAVILALDQEIPKLDNRYFMSRFRRRLEGYKSRFNALNANKQDPDYLKKLAQLCDEIHQGFIHKKRLTTGVGALAVSVQLLSIVAIILLCFLVFPAVTIPSLACAAMMGSTIAVMFGGIAGMVGLTVRSFPESDKRNVLKGVGNKLSLFYKPSPETAHQPVSKNFSLHFAK